MSYNYNILGYLKPEKEVALTLRFLKMSYCLPPTTPSDKSSVLIIVSEGAAHLLEWT